MALDSVALVRHVEFQDALDDHGIASSEPLRLQGQWNESVGGIRRFGGSFLLSEGRNGE